MDHLLLHGEVRSKVSAVRSRNRDYPRREIIKMTVFLGAHVSPPDFLFKGAPRVFRVYSEVQLGK